MKLSSKGITAIKMFIDLGEHYSENYISLLDISKRKDISKKFLEQIVPLYKNAGLILGNRGNQGGYRLAKTPNQITLKDIVYITENIFGKINSGSLTIDEAFDGLDSLMDEYLTKITLENLVEKQILSYSNNYYI